MASERGPAKPWLWAELDGKPGYMGDSPVCEALVDVLSRAGHVKSCLNIGGPPSKAKYYLLTDSEPVPWGKGEKYPDKGSETVSETGRLQTVGASLRGDGVPFV